jgi:hypothetical protein
MEGNVKRVKEREKSPRNIMGEMEPRPIKQKGGLSAALVVHS